ATRRKHEGWDTDRLPEPRWRKSRGRGRLQTTNLLEHPTVGERADQDCRQHVSANATWIGQRSTV
ncbi:hypothetical protein T265_10829, partial [Opisthorchis viverrini]